MDAKTLGDRIRELRLDQDLSLRQLAVRVGKSAPFISDIELGRRFPSARVLGAIAEQLGVEASDLREYDYRAAVRVLGHLSRTNPQWGFALRTAAEEIEKGLTPEELVRKLTGGSQERESP